MPGFLVRFHDGILGLPAVAIGVVGDFPLLLNPVHDLLMSQATRANPAGAGRFNQTMIRPAGRPWCEPVHWRLRGFGQVDHRRSVPSPRTSRLFSPNLTFPAASAVGFFG
jgi:hypothetical protein